MRVEIKILSAQMRTHIWKDLKEGLHQLRGIHYRWFVGLCFVHAGGLQSLAKTRGRAITANSRYSSSASVSAVANSGGVGRYYYIEIHHHHQQQHNNRKKRTEGILRPVYTKQG